MISSLTGRVLSRNVSSAVIEVGGIGFCVFATADTLSTLTEGESVTLPTVLVVKEDSLTLYGFADAEERSVFEVLTGISGIGPRIALAVLTVFSPDGLRAVLAAKNEKELTRVPGIGIKGARRMILEIGDRLGPGSLSAPKVSPVAPGAENDVVQALVNLGWNERDAQQAYGQAAQNIPAGTAAQLLRGALQILGSRM